MPQTKPITLPPVSLGTASLGNLFTAISDAQAEEVLKTAWGAGIRYFDTAPHYGRGLSEQRLGHFLNGRDGAIVSTKIGRVLSPAKASILEANGFINPAQNDVRYDYSGDGVYESFAQSCARLGRDHIDILYAHDLGTMVLGDDAAGHMSDFLESGLDALRALRREGRIKAIGLGVNEIDVCLEVLGHADLDLILLAGRYTLLDRSAADQLLPICLRRNVGIVIGGVFNSGILATGAVAGAHYNYEPAPPAIMERTRGLERICSRHGVNLADAALQFPGQHPAVVSTLIGTGKPQYVLSNLDGIRRTCPDAFWTDINAVHP